MQRSASLNEIEIAGYLDGTLSERKRRSVERALASRQDLCERMGIIGDVLSSGDALPSAGGVPEHLIEKIVRAYVPKASPLDIVLSIAGAALRVVRSAPAILLAPCPRTPAFRKPGAGASSLAIFSKDFDELTVRVGVERITKDRCNFHLTAADRAAASPARRLRAELILCGREIASSLFEGGEVLFEDVRPGRYEIVVRESRSVRARLSIKLQS